MPLHLLLRVVLNDPIRILRSVAVRIRPLAIAGGVSLCGVLALPGLAAAQRTDHPDLVRAIEAYDAGELQRALSLLQAAPALMDPHDSAVRSVYTGLIRFAEGDPDGARRAFAQAVRSDPSIRLDAAIHSPSRIDAFDAARAVVAEELRGAADAIERSGDIAGALQAWRVVTEADPADAIAQRRIQALEAELRNQAIARQEELLAEAAADTAAPATEPVESSPPAVPRLNPGQALAMGLVVPGLGQFYTRRPVRGVLALGIASAALAAGLMSERLEVDCRSVPIDDTCPAADILDERTTRPYLAPAIAVVAGVALVSAIDAFMAARRTNAEQGVLGTSAGQGLRILVPAIGLGSDGVEARLLRLRFD
jgi:tetratricopeptide (TPR) repeat protein